MTYKTILAVLQDKTDASRVLEFAGPLAARFSAHLIGFHAESIPLPYVTPMGFPDTEFIAMSEEAGAQRNAEIKEIFQTHMRRAGISNSWRSVQNISNDSASAVLSVARTSDLIVVQQANPEQETGLAAVVEALLFESGRPVLLIPHFKPVQSTFRKVLVAWNGTQQATRAVFDALPFICEAQETEILSLDAADTSEQDAVVAGADIAAALARHGAKITFAAGATAGISAGEAIGNRIVDTQADLLVMGAYSQSWLKQFFFGGTTRTVLQTMPVATLMAR